MRSPRITSGLAAPALIVAAVTLSHAVAVDGHETDQYTPPVGRVFADLGPYLSRIARSALEDAVAETNAAILSPLTHEDPAALPAEDPQSAAYVAARVWKHMFMAFPLNEGLDAQLASAPLRAQFPGLVTVHWPVHSVYNDPLLLIDPTKAVRALFRAGTVNVGGTLIGTDKLIHFINLGRIYHADYLVRIRDGASEADASAEAVTSVNANPLLSEEGVLGYLTTGIRSNGDLAANYAGLRFYRNLTEAVRIGPRELPPMLAHDGSVWRVAVPPDANLLAPFVTPHWNEVLNPNRYLDYVADRMRGLIEERCPATTEAYVDPRGRTRDRRGFESAEQRLSTYFGEPYGHADSQQVSVAGLCFRGSPAPPADGEVQLSADSDVDRLGRTPLWWAAHDGDASAMAGAAERGADPNAVDADGETALHAAARAGNAASLQWLLAHGADPNQLSRAGQTPLMIAAAAGDAELAANLLRAGADPALRGTFGMSALHAAALCGSVETAKLLMAAGAPPDLANDAGNTALHLASGAGSDALVDALVTRGALATARNAIGDTPIDVATRQGHHRTARQLAIRGAGESRMALALPGDAQPLVTSAVDGDTARGSRSDRGAGPAR